MELIIYRTFNNSSQTKYFFDTNQYNLILNLELPDDKSECIFGDLVEIQLKSCLSLKLEQLYTSYNHYIEIYWLFINMCGWRSHPFLLTFA